MNKQPYREIDTSGQIPEMIGGAIIMLLLALGLIVIPLWAAWKLVSMLISQ